MNVLIRRKPILMAEGSEWLKLFKYKYQHTAWFLNVPVKIFTDLKFEEFDNLCDGKYTRKQIEKFELTGRI